MNYSEQLMTMEWQNRRSSILKRDNFQCQVCGLKKPTIPERDLDINPFMPIDTWKVQRKGYKYFRQNILLYELPELINCMDKIYNQSVHNDYLFITNFFNWHLQVHHRYYLANNLAWEYPDEALITYCRFCHGNYHSKHEVAVFVLVNEKLELHQKLSPCAKCNGTGYLKEFAHFQNGVCFACNGNRFNW